MANHARSIRERVIALSEEGRLSAALQVNCTVSRGLLQEHCYRNTRGMGKLEGAEELGYGPARDAVLVTEAQRNPFVGARDLKTATGFPGLITRLF
jgi:hypothetical protein